VNNLTKRILTAVVAIPVILVLCMSGGIYFFAFVAVASAVALHEFYVIARAKGAKPMVVLGVISGFLINLSFLHYRLRSAIAGWFQTHGIEIAFPSQAQLLLITLILIVVVLSLVELFRNNGSPLLNL